MSPKKFQFLSQKVGFQKKVSVRICLKILAFIISRDENFVFVLSTSLHIFSWTDRMHLLRRQAGGCWGKNLKLFWEIVMLMPPTGLVLFFSNLSRTEETLSKRNKKCIKNISMIYQARWCWWFDFLHSCRCFFLWRWSAWNWKWHQTNHTLNIVVW